MRVRTAGVAVAVALMMLVAACRHDEQGMTGLYGNSIVQGQVAMTSGASPAGVEVTLRGTGMTATLAADGRFTFVNAPDNATLHFGRGDGIDETMPARAGQTLSIVLADHASGGRRRSSVVPAGLIEIEGTVSSATTSTLIVTTSHGDVTLTLTTATVIRKGNVTVQPGDLVGGTPVHVKASVSGDVKTAVLVTVQVSDDTETDEVEFTGPVAAIGTSSITVNGTTVNIDSSTVIRKAGQIITLADVKVGDVVEVDGTRIDASTVHAKRIGVEKLEDVEDAEVQGIVSAVGSSSITVAGTIVNVTASTNIRKQGRMIALSDIHVGDSVDAEGSRIDATTILADQIHVGGGKGGD